jgi:predicted NAD/FAD-dependent oxidoreductase
MSTRYADPFYFDHGTQFFTARDPAFQAFLAPYIERGVVADWQGKVVTLEPDTTHADRMWFEPHYVASPNMNSLCKALAEGITVTLGCEVAPLQEKKNDGWHLWDAKGAPLGVYDLVISTAPPAQTVRLFAGFIPPDHPLHQTQLLGCYTLMLGFMQPWKKSWIAAKVRNHPIEWIAVNSSKPNRNAALTSLVVQTSNAWAEAHIDDDMQAAEAFLIEQCSALVGMDCSKADYRSTHRWRYALVDAPQKHAPLWDASLGLASVGDWCSASRIEEVWLNAQALAKSLKHTGLPQTPKPTPIEN